VLAAAVLATALVANAAALSANSPSAARSPAWNSNWFRSPTGNIRCRYWPDDRLLACTTLNNRRLVGVTLFGHPFVRSAFGYSFPGGPVLSYGDTWAVAGRVKCWSRYSGMTCRSLQTGSGFFINRTSFRLF
jgi:hypothetical protein